MQATTALASLGLITALLTTPAFAGERGEAAAQDRTHCSQDSSRHDSHHDSHRDRRHDRRHDAREHRHGDHRSDRHGDARHDPHPGDRQNHRHERPTQTGAWQAIQNSAQAGEPGQGWQYFQDGSASRAVVISPSGDYYLSRGQGLRWVAATSGPI